jgi:thiol-disulfide isomerase/thioredoxin
MQSHRFHTRLEIEAETRHTHPMSTHFTSWPARLGLLAAALAAGLGWYALSGAPAATVSGECRDSAAVAERLKPLAKGAVAAVSVGTSPKIAPEVAFFGPDGGDRSFSDLKGRWTLVNLWATWCVPCREEMPALDALQAKFGGERFEVVAINVDTRNPDKPRTWLLENGIHKLAYYADPSGKLLQVLQRSGHVVGLPTSLLIGPDGCEVAILKGPAAWASPDAFAFIESAIAKP